MPKSKNAWSYTSTPAVRLHGVVLSLKKKKLVERTNYDTPHCTVFSGLLPLPPSYVQISFQHPVLKHSQSVFSFHYKGEHFVTLSNEDNFAKIIYIFNTTEWAVDFLMIFCALLKKIQICIVNRSGKSRDSLVGIATKLRPGRSGFYGSIPGGGWEFFSSPSRQERNWCPLSLLSNGPQGLCPWE
jgi:hypothetical protein